MITTTTTMQTELTDAPPYYIPAAFSYKGPDAPAQIAAQLYADGSLYVNWPLVRAYTEACPVDARDGSISHSAGLHMLLALLEGRIRDQLT